MVPPFFHRVSPSHTFFSSFFSRLPVLMSWQFIPSFFCAHSGPALSVYVHNYITLNPGFRSPRSENEVGFIVCPCALGSSSLKPRTPLSCLVLFSCLHPFVRVACTSCTFALTLDYSPFLGEACVCVCVTLGVTGILLDCVHLAGECGMIVGPHSTKPPQSWDMECDQLGVPAFEL